MSHQRIVTITDGDIPLPPPLDERLRASVSEKLFARGTNDVPRRIEHFEIRDAGIEGGMGVVFRAFDTTLDRPVALKLLRRDLIGSAGQRAQVLREARALARVSHPNVVSVHEVREHDEAVYFVMEYVDGVTLRTWQRERTWQEIVAMYIGAAKGLTAAHAAKLVHRDFKPDNVLVGEDGRCRVADFGIALALEFVPTTANAASLSAASDRQASRPNAGTHGYMAPEQHGDGPVTARSDQFAFCVALWEALYGVRPFSTASLVGYTIDPTRAIVLRPGTLRGPRRLRKVLQRGLSIAPEQRFATMDQLATELERTLRKRSRLAMIGLAVAGSGLAWWIVRDVVIDRCAARGVALEGVWGPEQRERLSRSLARQHPWAAASIEIAAGHLDVHAARWRSAWNRSCRATPLVPNDDRSYTLACLEGQRRELGVLVKQLEGGAAPVVARAEWIVGTLEAPERCLDANTPLHLTDLAHEDFDRAYQDLATLRIMASAGEVAGVDAIIDRALARVSPWRSSPVLAETLFATAQVDIERGHVDDAIARLTEAGELATKLFHDELAASAWSTLALVLAERTSRVAEAELASTMAEGMLARTPSSRRLHAQHALVQAELAAARSNWAAARRILEAAREELARTPSDHGVLAPLAEERLRVTITRKLANVLVEMGEFEAGEALYMSLREPLAARLGDGHPEVIRIDLDLALLLRDRIDAGDLRPALPTRCLELTASVLARVTQAYGPDSPYHLTPTFVLGELAVASGDFERAALLLEETRNLESRHFNADALEWGFAPALASKLAQARNDYVGWALALEELLTAWQHGPNALHQRPFALQTLASVRAILEEWDASLSTYERLRTETTASTWHAVALAGMGHALVNLRRTDAARHALERARTLLPAARKETLLPHDTLMALEREIADDLAIIGD